MASIRVSGSAADDVIVRSNGAYVLVGGRGDDYLEVSGARGLTGINGQDGDDVLVGSVEGFGQIHMRGGDGEDRIIMRLDNAQGHQGHHAYGGNGADRFEFQNVGATRHPILGRIDDFDPRRDTLWYGNQQLDLYDLPSGFRVVSYLGQQWLSIHDKALYALDGARQGGDEQHFSPLPPQGIAALKSTSYVNPYNFVPAPAAAKRPLDVIDLPVDDRDFTGSAAGEWIRDAALNQRDAGGALTQIAAAFVDAGAGNDVVDAGKGDDTVLGGDGHDLIAGGLDNDHLFGGRGNDRIWGGSEDDHIEGGGGGDKLLGGLGNDYIDGDWGNDRLWGEQGQDSLVGGGGNDVLGGGAGSDRMWGGPGQDTLYGGSGNDLLKGGIGADRLFGDGGTDWIFGGAGADIATGGKGADQFVFRAGDLVRWSDAASAGADPFEHIDRITDFEIGADKLRFLPDTGITNLDPVQAWKVTFEGAAHFVLRVRGSDERILIDAGEDARWSELLSADNFIFG